jgi:hypothetical protein
MPKPPVSESYTTAGTAVLDITLADGTTFRVEDFITRSRFERHLPAPVSTPVYPDGKHHKPSGWGAETSFIQMRSFVHRPRLLGGSNDGTDTVITPIWPGVTFAPYQSLKASVVQSAAAGIGKAISQLAVAAREAEEVLSLTREYGNAVQRGLHNIIDVMEGSWKAREQMRDFLRHGWKEVPSYYLSYIFGIAPLAEDLENAVDKLSDLGDRTVFILRKRGRHIVDEEYTMITSDYYAGGYVEIKVHRKVAARAALFFEIPASRISVTGFATPFSQAYQTTRLSFVLDYFLPIGKWVEAAEACQVAPFFTQGYIAVKIEDRFRDQGVLDQNIAPDPGFVTVNPQGFRDAYLRETFDTFPYGEIFSTPRSHLPEVRELGVLAALIGQRLSKIAGLALKGK